MDLSAEDKLAAAKALAAEFDAGRGSQSFTRGKSRGSGIAGRGAPKTNYIQSKAEYPFNRFSNFSHSRFRGSGSGFGQPLAPTRRTLPNYNPCMAIFRPSIIAAVTVSAPRFYHEVNNDLRLVVPGSTSDDFERIRFLEMLNAIQDVAATDDSEKTDDEFNDAQLFGAFMQSRPRPRSGSVTTTFHHSIKIVETSQPDDQENTVGHVTPPGSTNVRTPGAVDAQQAAPSAQVVSSGHLHGSGNVMPETAVKNEAAVNHSAVTDVVRPALSWNAKPPELVNVSSSTSSRPVATTSAQTPSLANLPGAKHKSSGSRPTGTKFVLPSPSVSPTRAGNGPTQPANTGPAGGVDKRGTSNLSRPIGTENVRPTQQAPSTPPGLGRPVAPKVSGHPGSETVSSPELVSHTAAWCSILPMNRHPVSESVKPPGPAPSMAWAVRPNVPVSRLPMSESVKSSGPTPAMAWAIHPSVSTSRLPVSESVKSPGTAPTMAWPGRLVVPVNRLIVSESVKPPGPAPPIASSSRPVVPNAGHSPALGAKSPTAEVKVKPESGPSTGARRRQWSAPFGLQQLQALSLTAAGDPMQIDTPAPSPERAGPAGIPVASPPKLTPTGSGSGKEVLAHWRAVRSMAQTQPPVMGLSSSRWASGSAEGPKIELARPTPQSLLESVSSIFTKSDEATDRALAFSWQLDSVDQKVRGLQQSRWAH